jgi:cbb3-type cytochrome oxidase subunit 3
MSNAVSPVGIAGMMFLASVVFTMLFIAYIYYKSKHKAI